MRKESTREEESFSSWVFGTMLHLDVQDRSKMRRSLVK